jgi:ribosomal protein L37AE/L43A
MSESRGVPYYCPFCAGENLFPHGETHGQWECRSCRRVFAVKFIGLLRSDHDRSE